MTIREIVNNTLHNYFWDHFHIDISMDTEKDVLTGKYFDALDLVELEMDMNKQFKIELNYAFEKWKDGTFKDIANSIVEKLKEEGL